jgi:hypothetical protein
LKYIPTLSKEFESKDTKIWILLTQELIDNDEKIIEKFKNDW